MSDRSGLSIGSQPWRVAVGGDQIRSMTPEQIAQAYRTGELNSQTPIWPPGYGGWQALGSIQQLRSLAANDAGPPALSQYDESEDDPTRMWMGPVEEYDISQPMPPVPAPPVARPSTRTGPRRVEPPLPNIPYTPQPASQQPASQQHLPQQHVPQQHQGFQPPSFQPQQAPAFQPPAFQPPAFQPPAWGGAQQSAPPVNVSPAQFGGVTTAPRPSSEPPFRARPRRSALLMGAGLVGLIGLASAVLLARGNSAPERDKKAAMVDVAKPAAVEKAAPAPVVPAVAEAKIVEPEPVAAAPAEAEPVAEASNSERLAPSSTRADEEVAPTAKSGASVSARSSAKASVSKSAKARPTREPAAKRSAEKIMAEKLAAKAEKAEKAAVEKADKTVRTVASDGSPLVATSQKKEAEGNNIDHEAAASALSNSASLASSCRPPGGPTGTGKVRVTYNNDGSVGTVEVMPATFAGTTTGSCVSMLFRRAKIPAFKGEPPTFIKSFTIPD